MVRTWLFLAAVAGFLGVALGAFGAHALKQRLSPEALAWFDTGVRYHLVHAVALGVVAWAAERRPDSTAVTVAGVALGAGILIFSGTLYLMALTGVRWLGAITPVGGTALLVGWAALAIAALKG